MSKSCKDGHSILKIAFPSDRLPVLKLTCQAHGTTMSDFGREAVLRALEAPTAPVGLPTGPHVFLGAVEAAARASAGVPRVQLECLVAAVVNHLYANV